MSNLQIWIDALRSGKYQQVDGHLAAHIVNDEVGYCCLGVACHLFDPEYNILNIKSCAVTTKTANALSEIAIYGQNDPAEYWGSTEITINEILAMANDRGFTFAQIADALEEYRNDPRIDVLKNWFIDHDPEGV